MSTDKKVANDAKKNKNPENQQISEENTPKVADKKKADHCRHAYHHFSQTSHH